MRLIPSRLANRLRSPSQNSPALATIERSRNTARLKAGWQQPAFFFCPHNLLTALTPTSRNLRQSVAERPPKVCLEADIGSDRARRASSKIPKVSRLRQLAAVGANHC